MRCTTAVCCEVVRREAGIRIYAVHEHAPAPRDAATRDAHLDALVDVVVAKYAPLPAASLSYAGAPAALRGAAMAGRAGARARSGRRRGSLTRGSMAWTGIGRLETRPPSEQTTTVRLLAPFDPVVWDRRRFELLLGLGVSLRGVYAGAEAEARLLRAAAALARPRDRLGECVGQRHRVAVGHWLRRPRRREAASSAAHSTRNWVAWVSFSDCRDSGPDVRCAAQSDRHTVSPIGDRHETRSIHFHPRRPRAVGGRRLRTRRRRISARSRSRPTR